MADFHTENMLWIFYINNTCGKILKVETKVHGASWKSIFCSNPIFRWENWSSERLPLNQPHKRMWEWYKDKDEVTSLQRFPLGVGAGDTRPEVWVAMWYISFVCSWRLKQSWETGLPPNPKADNRASIAQRSLRSSMAYRGRLKWKTAHRKTDESQAERA